MNDVRALAEKWMLRYSGPGYLDRYLIASIFSDREYIQNRSEEEIKEEWELEEYEYKAGDMVALAKEPERARKIIESWGPFPQWESGPLPFARAACVWAEAAGIAGAYVPEEFARLVIQHLSSSPNEEELREEVLPFLLEEAEARACWRAKFFGNGSYCGPRGLEDKTYEMPRTAFVQDNELIWETSVRTILARTSQGWEVRIEGVHYPRARAANNALGRLGTTTGVDWEGWDPE